MRIIQSLFRSTTALNKELVDLMKEKMGITHDPREAGFILPDGTMLDFSGKNSAPFNHHQNLSGTRSIDHRWLPPEAWSILRKKYPAPWDVTDPVHLFMMETGAVRFSPESGGFSYYDRMPTDKQLNVVANYWKWSKGKLDSYFIDKVMPGKQQDKWIEFKNPMDLQELKETLSEL